MADTNLQGLFNPQSVEAPKRNTNEYRPSYKQGKGGIYEAIIRFVPNWADPQRCIISKGVTYLKNPLNGSGRYIDDPSVNGQPSPCRDFFSMCWRTNNPAIQDFVKKNCSTKTQYASLVEIIQDNQHPELQGKILVFIYGQKIWNMLNEEEHPSMGQEGKNPFHPVYGRYFHLKCTAQGQFNDFTQSKFFDNIQNNQVLPSGIWYIDPATPNQYSVATEQSDQQAIFDFLKANSPDLFAYDYHEWTADTAKFVNETLDMFNSYLQAGQIPSAPMQQPQGGYATPPAPPAMQQNASPVFPGATAPAAPSFGAPAAPAAPSFGPAPSAAPAAPAAPSFGAPAAPAAPAAPVAPSFGAPAAPSVAPAPAPISLGGLSMGAPAAPAAPAAPSVSGVELPQGGSPAAPAYQAAPGIGGADLESVLAQL